MRRPLVAAALAVAALAAPASASVDPWEIYHRYFGECMDCFPQVQCVNRPCEILDAVARIIPS